jgi:hypothetical protein
MIIPIICFSIAAILLILLVVFNVRAQSARRKENAMGEEPTEEQVSLLETIKEEQDPIESTIQKVAEEVAEEEKISEEQSISETNSSIHEENNRVINEELEAEDDQDTKPFKMKDSSYREALKKFQAKKPELAKKKTQISDSDYRNALKAMQNREK